MRMDRLKSRQHPVLIRRALCIVLGIFSVLLCAQPTYAVDDIDLYACSASLVYSLESQTILYADHTDRQVFPGPVVKLMTAILAAESPKGINNETVVVSEGAVRNADGLVLGLKAGEEMPMQTLIESIIHLSSNDSALAIAEAVAGSVEEFVRQMNQKAKELGMKDTVFTNPTGLHDDLMISTVDDILKLSICAITNPIVHEISEEIIVHIPETNKRSRAKDYHTRNYLISNRIKTDYYLPIANGLICGSTDNAGYCAVSTSQHNGLNYIAIVMGAGTHSVVDPESEKTGKNGGATEYITWNDSLLNAARLLSWADANFGYRTVVDYATPICEINVRLAETVDRVVLMPERKVDLFLPLDCDINSDVSLSYRLNSDTVSAPISAGTKMGTLTISYDDIVMEQVPLVIMNNIEQSSWLLILDRGEKLLKTPLFRILIIVLFTGTVCYVFVTASIRYRKKKSAEREYIKQHRYLKKK